MGREDARLLTDNDIIVRNKELRQKEKLVLEGRH